MFKEFSKKKTEPSDMFKENLQLHLQLHIHLQPPPIFNHIFIKTKTTKTASLIMVCHFLPLSCPLVLGNQKT